MTLRAAAAAVLALACACTPPARPVPAPGAVRVALVDSVPFVTEMEDGVLRRVEVRSPAGVDTIPWVLTQVLPVVLADGSVLGLAFEGAGLRSAFSWHPARPLELIALPEDLDRWFTTPAFSPDGRYLAYVTYGEGNGRGMVRLGAAGQVVVRTDSVEVPPTDVALNFARWRDAETFEIYLDVDETGWHRFLGTVSAGVTRADTVGPSDLDSQRRWCRSGRIPAGPLTADPDVLARQIRKKNGVWTTAVILRKAPAPRRREHAAGCAPTEESLSGTGGGLAPNPA